MARAVILLVTAKLQGATVNDAPARWADLLAELGWDRRGGRLRLDDVEKPPG